MEFHVNLIRVPSIDSLSSWSVFELMVNARHIAGRYWAFEGDVESFEYCRGIELIAEGITESFGDLSNDEFIEHCADVFGVSFDDSAPAWKMLDAASKPYNGVLPEKIVVAERSEEVNRRR